MSIPNESHSAPSALAVPPQDAASPHGIERLGAARLATERTLPLDPVLGALLGSEGLVRGQAVACRGPAARSLAIAASASAVVLGSWIAVLGVDDLGVEAVADAGLPLERLVRVRPGSDGVRAWADLCLAALDGFELLLTSPPGRVPTPLATAIRRRLRSRAGCLLVIGDPRGLEVDVELSSATPSWQGIGTGTGRLADRSIEVRASGRRVHRGGVASVSLPGPDGRLRAPEVVSSSPIRAAV
jgi:hypothetical protein